MGNLPWLVTGDFNIIQEDGECIGGSPRSLLAMEEFNICIDHYGLLEIGFVGSWMTWCNGHGGPSWSWARLDRVLVNAGFLACFTNANYKYLERKHSDHSSLLVNWQREV